jgi:hypothetical protein
LTPSTSTSSRLRLPLFNSEIDPTTTVQNTRLPEAATASVPQCRRCRHCKPAVRVRGGVSGGRSVSVSRRPSHRVVLLGFPFLMGFRSTPVASGGVAQPPSGACIHTPARSRAGGGCLLIFSPRAAPSKTGAHIAIPKLHVTVNRGFLGEGASCSFDAPRISDALDRSHARRLRLPNLAHRLKMSRCNLCRPRGAAVQPTTNRGLRPVDPTHARFCTSLRAAASTATPV